MLWLSVDAREVVVWIRVMDSDTARVQRFGDGCISISR
jgi:hypothetical protein